MTCHRLIHCQPDQLVHHVRRRPSVQLQPPHQVVPVWFPGAPRSTRTVVGWLERCAGTRSMVVCCLEVERSATGVIAHLSTVSTGGIRPLPKSISTIMVKAWTARLLAALATGVEAEQQATPGPSTPRREVS